MNAQPDMAAGARPFSLRDVETAMRENAPRRAATIAADVVGQARLVFLTDPGIPARGNLVDALLALAISQLSSGDHDGAKSALGEIEDHIAHAACNDHRWQIRAGDTTRLRIAAAQAAGDHEEALAIIQSALSSITGEATEADGMRLQLVMRGLQSRLSLGQVVETAADMELTGTLLDRLATVIPERPANIMRASLTLHEASVALLRGLHAQADAKFGEGLDLLDRLGGSDVNGLRRQFVQAWTEALNAQGRSAEVGMLLSRSTSEPGPSRAGHYHHAGCGCGEH